MFEGGKRISLTQKISRKPGMYSSATNMLPFFSAPKDRFCHVKKTVALRGTTLTIMNHYPFFPFSHSANTSI